MSPIASHRRARFGTHSRPECPSTPARWKDSRSEQMGEEGEPGMRWTPDLITGNAVVDAEHRELIALIDKLELVGSGPDGRGIAEALDELTDYVFVHFQMEEKLMQREGYPAAAVEAHVAEHRKLDRETKELVEQYSDGTLTTVQPIVIFLYEWFQHHIAQVDRAMAEYIRANHARLGAPGVPKDPGAPA